MGKSKKSLGPVHDFSVEVTLIEEGKESCSIAQVKEVLKIANKLTDGGLYKLIRERAKNK